MTVKDQATLIGKEITHNFGGLDVRVTIQDVKLSYGVQRVLVSVTGQKSNSIWINY